MEIKQENEITMKLKCDVNELCMILENKGFKVVNKFTIKDIFMVPNALNSKLKDLTSRDILKEAVLIRDIENEFKGNRVKNITFKKKCFNEFGEILSQEAINCSINSIEEATNLFQAIKYHKIMSIIEKDIVYGKDDFEIAIKDIKDGDKLVEIETVSSNNKINTIEKLKKEITNLQLPLDTTNFFVKKAEIELDKILKS